jgi:hypothetical protein
VLQELQVVPERKTNVPLTEFYGDKGEFRAIKVNLYTDPTSEIPSVSITSLAHIVKLRDYLISLIDNETTDRGKKY